MIRPRKQLIFALLIILLAVAVRFPPTKAQEPPPPEPLAQGARPLDQVDVLTMPPVDNQALLDRDKGRPTFGVPLQFAEPLTVDVTPATHGTWEKLKDGAWLWRLRIASSGALSLNLGFTRYAMPPAGRLFLYSPDYSTIIGPFTEGDNEVHGQLWTPPVAGHEIVIEVSLPAAVASQLELRLTQVSHTYRGLGPSPKRIAGISGACNVDVACPQADGWRDEVRSVARYIVSGASLCSGALVNSTALDGTPYFLTAFHCGVNAATAPSVVTFWNFENSTCRPPDSPESGQPGDGQLTQFSTGAIFRAGYALSDFTLIELDDPINPAFNAHWAGWDNTSADATSATTIHHPNGAEKRISFENDPTTTTSLGETFPPGDGTHIRVEDWDLGTTELGSSGAPLFNQDHRIVGQLHAGFAACGNDESDWYGRLAFSWDGGGTLATRLKDWLDPLNTGATVLDGSDDLGPDVVVDVSVTKVASADPAIINTPLTYTLTIANTGPDDATGVVLTDTLPGGVVFASVDTTQGDCGEAGGIITCNLGSIVNGATVTVTVVVTPTELGTITNAVSVTAAELDIESSNNLDITVDTTVENPPAPRYVAPGGSDTTDCSDPLNPCQTINHAIFQATGGDMVNIATGTYTENVTIDKDLTLQGGGAAATIVDGNGSGSVFTVGDNASVTLADLTITNGNAYYGGGIYNEGTLMVKNSTVSGNTSDWGGGISNYYYYGTLVVENSTVSGNTANDTGGGILNGYAGTVTVENSTVSGNTSDWWGGGILNYGTVTVENSTVSGNTTNDTGGGIHNEGTLMVENSTVSDNTANDTGGGIWDDGDTDVKSTIIANNAAPAGPDCYGWLDSYGYNLIEDTSDCTINEATNPGTNITGQDPNLGLLQDNGGPTLTHALLHGSLAIDAAKDCTTVAGDDVTQDQRGVSRPQPPGGDCDIGAYESVDIVTHVFCPMVVLGSIGPQ